MTRTLIGAVAAVAVFGLSGVATAEGGCSQLHTVQQSTPVDTAQIEQPATPQPAKPADSDS